MQFPRIKKFNFSIDNTYIVPANRVGRLDKIAYDLYGNVRMYKPLASANNIVIPMGVRYGIRPNSEAIRNECILKGFKGINLENEIERIESMSRLSDNDWLYYGDSTMGYVSDVYENRILMIPSYSSAVTWLGLYENIKIED